MSKITNISLTPHFETFISRALENGRYHNASEVITAALELLEAEEKKTAALSTAIEEGLASGWVSDFDPEAYLKEIKDEK
jgi:antitoxin ParD1/3/4